MKRLIVAAALALCACASQDLTTGQTLYAAFGAYRTALAGALDYARSPGADPAVVRRINAVAQSEPAAQALRYARAYVTCGGVSAGAIGDIDCAAFDFRRRTASGHLIQLRALVVSLNERR